MDFMWRLPCQESGMVFHKEALRIKRGIRQIIFLHSKVFLYSYLCLVFVSLAKHVYFVQRCWVVSLCRGLALGEILDMLKRKYEKCASQCVLGSSIV